MTDLKRTEREPLDLSWDEAMAMAKTDAQQLAARLRGDKTLVRNGPSLWPTKHVRRVRPLRWQWEITDQATGEVLASGHALAERWAWHQAGVACGRVYGKRAAERRAES